MEGMTLHTRWNNWLILKFQKFNLIITRIPSGFQKAPETSIIVWKNPKSSKNSIKALKSSNKLQKVSIDQKIWKSSWKFYKSSKKLEKSLQRNHLKFNIINVLSSSIIPSLLNNFPTILKALLSIQLRTALHAI